MNSLGNAHKDFEAIPGSANAVDVLAREAGVAFQPQRGIDCGADPIAEWLSLMEVVQMLCPEWPVRDSPMLGAHWRL